MFEKYPFIKRFPCQAALGRRSVAVHVPIFHPSYVKLHRLCTRIKHIYDILTGYGVSLVRSGVKA